MTPPPSIDAPTPPASGPDAARSSPGYIPHSRPAVGDEEVEALRRAVMSGRLAQGPEVEQFEHEVAASVGRPHDGVAVSSGTAAIYTALRALGVGKGDAVQLPGFACASLLQAVRYSGAEPVFVDSDPHTLNPDPDHARRQLTARVKVIVVPHLFGFPADSGEFSKLGPPVIEDCAQCFAAATPDGCTGSLGSLSVASFYGTKLVAAGEGGMVLGANPVVLDMVRAMRDCESPKAGLHSFNFKLSDLHAAVGRVQLRRLPELLARRRELAARYRDELGDLPIELPPDDAGLEHQAFRFVVKLAAGHLEEVLARCEQIGLACRRPVGKLPRPVSEQLDRLPGCRDAWERACSLPLYPALSEQDEAEVIRRFRHVVQGLDA